MIDKSDFRAFLRLLAFSATKDYSAAEKAVEWAYKDQEKPKKTKPAMTKEQSEKLDADINKVYAAYPTKCPIAGRSTGKCYADKTKIAAALKQHTADELVGIIAKYLDDCAKSNTYIKNFGTFLNNIPDFSEQPNKQQQQEHQCDIFDDPEILAIFNERRKQ